MAGRFKLLTDEHWSKGHIKAVRSAGWEVVRLVDVGELGQGAAIPRYWPTAPSADTSG